MPTPPDESSPVPADTAGDAAPPRETADAPAHASQPTPSDVISTTFQNSDDSNVRELHEQELVL